MKFKNADLCKKNIKVKDKIMQISFSILPIIIKILHPEIVR